MQGTQNEPCVKKKIKLGTENCLSDEMPPCPEEEFIFNKDADDTQRDLKCANVFEELLDDSNNSIIGNVEPNISNDQQQNNKKRRPERKVAFNKSYLDFIEDDPDIIAFNDAFPSDDTTEWVSESDSDSGDNEKGAKVQKKVQKKKTIENSTTKETILSHSIEKKKLKKELLKENEIKKNKGETYVTNKGKVIPAKSMKPNPCVGKKCGNDCGSISEERRENLHKYFWNLNNHQRRKDWISQCALKKSVKRPGKETTNNRSCTYEYFINEGEGRRKVCQKYLLNTLDITQRFVLYTLETMTDGFAKADERGKSGGYNRTSEDVAENAKQFIMSLPLVPSHYCRKDSTRVYLPQDFKNISNLYRIYLDHCATEGMERNMSFKVFNSWFKNSFNIGFHVPKKDKCMICSADNKTKTTEHGAESEKTEQEKEKIAKHIEEKEESYKRFKFHQQLHKKDKTTLCCSFDMEKVLNTPHGADMRLFYSRKLAVYNFTIYESITRMGYCYVWTEADARRGANDISTCLFDYIQSVDSRRTIKTLLLYSDSCYGQNKNKIVLSMLPYALSKCNNLNIIQMNYLIPGHTYMPVDSMHATIENFVKNTTVWAPSQWPTIFQFARQKPTRYKVSVLRGKDFVGFDDVLNNTFKKNQKLPMSKLQIVTFNKQKPNVMYVKYSILQDTATEISLTSLSDEIAVKKNLYPVGLPIPASKYKDLKKLVDKKVIPIAYSDEFLNLKSSNKLKDRLEDTDEEDVGIEED